MAGCRPCSGARDFPGAVRTHRRLRGLGLAGSPGIPDGEVQGRGRGAASSQPLGGQIPSHSELGRGCFEARHAVVGQHGAAGSRLHSPTVCGKEPGAEPAVISGAGDASAGPVSRTAQAQRDRRSGLQVAGDVPGMQGDPQVGRPARPGQVPAFGTAAQAEGDSLAALDGLRVERERAAPAGPARAAVVGRAVRGASVAVAVVEEVPGVTSGASGPVSGSRTKRPRGRSRVRSIVRRRIPSASVAGSRARRSAARSKDSRNPSSRSTSRRSPPPSPTTTGPPVARGSPRRPHPRAAPPSLRLRPSALRPRPWPGRRRRATGHDRPPSAPGQRSPRIRWSPMVIARRPAGRPTGGKVSVAATLAVGGWDVGGRRFTARLAVATEDQRSRNHRGPDGG